MRPFALVVLVAFLSTTARADTKGGPGGKAVVEVTLGQIVDVVKSTIDDAPKDKVSDKARARQFVTNLRTLLAKTKDADRIYKDPLDEPLVQAFLKGKKVQWELIFAYFVAVMERTWPVLSKVNWVGSIVSGVITPTAANIGAGFEFCEPRGLEKEVGRKYVLNMLETWTAEEFARVLERKGCPSAMLGYLVSE